jgi:F-box interacting protein
VFFAFFAEQRFPGRMATYLPEEMLVKIFSWLPPKSLIRYKCVSKRWHALIGNPDFLSKNLLNHSILTQNPCDPRGLTLFFAIDKSEPCKRIHSFRSYDSLCCASQTPLDFPPELPHLFLVASCNGFLCVSDVMGSNLYLWNPATSSDLKAIPASPSCCRAEPSAARDDSGSGFHLVGFGFDSVSNDFKVVKLVDEDKDGYLEAKMYSLRSGCWRLLDMCVNLKLRLFSQRIALDGVFLWHVEDAGGDYMNNRILAFDFREEKFVTMPTPEATYSDEYTRALAELKGSVAMVLFPDEEEEYMCLDIWVMLEFGVSESWTRLLSIDLPLHLERPLGFWKNGELFMQNREGQLVLYDLLSQTETNLQFQGRRGTIKVVDCNFVQFEGMAPCLR